MRFPIIWLGVASCLFPGSTTPKPVGPPALDQTFGSCVALLRYEDAGYTDPGGSTYGNGMTIGRLQSFVSGVTYDPDDPRGVLDRTYHSTASSTVPDMAALSLYYEGIADGRICFTDGARGIKTYDSPDEMAQNELAMHVAIEAHDDLAAIA